MKTAFLKPRLVGKRFENHSVPVEVLKDWVAFEGLIVEAARWLYLEENPGRKRTPRGFAQSFSLGLSQIESGSAVAVLERPEQGSVLHFDDVQDWFDKARDRVIATIAAVGAGKPLDGLLPKSLLGYFDQFGRSLRDDESIEFSTELTAPPVVYNNRIRKILVLKSSTVYRTEEAIRGAMSELNLENQTFLLKLISGERVVGHFSDELRDAALSALGAYGESLVMVEGAVVRDQADTRKRIEQVSRIEPLDPLDVPARLEAFALLRDGWFDGQAMGFSKEKLLELSVLWLKNWPESVCLPHAYPTPEGAVQFEWSLNGIVCDLEVNLESLTASLTVSRVEDGELLKEASLALDSEGSWQELVDIISLYQGVQ